MRALKIDHDVALSLKFFGNKIQARKIHLKKLMMYALVAASVLAGYGITSHVAVAGSGPTYCWNEAKNQFGPNRCKTSADCDGARTCSKMGICQGTSRPRNPPKGPMYCINEANNKMGPNRCKTSADCDGARVCSRTGYCQGPSGHATR